MFEEYLTNYCWKRDQSNTLPIDRKESKAIPTIIMPIYSQSHRYCSLVTRQRYKPLISPCICYNSCFLMLLPALHLWLPH
ncbi:hypothetical protein B4901_13780 [Yersinia frederiksenii]|nr:hypothetical protein B4901_13780 [Yersinia frederiksenii]